MEAKTECYKAYQEAIADIEVKDIVYIDESGFEQNAVKDKGWGARGKPLLAKKSDKYSKRINIIAALSNGNIIAPMVYESSCTTELFNTWVKQFLIPQLRQGQVIVMDNASFHKSVKTKELIEAAGCRIIFLPPYSPELNPIEKFWANMKRWIKSRIGNFTKFYDAINAFFREL